MVHPSAWLIKPTPSTTEQRSRSIVSKYKTTFTFIKGLYYFGVHQYSPCSITHIHINKPPSKIYIKDTTQNRTLTFNTVKDINYICDSKEYFQLRKQIISLAINNSLFDHIGTHGNYYVTLPKVRGSSAGRIEHKDGVLCKDFYTLIAKDTMPTTEPTGDMFIGFNTLKEANSFIKYIKTDFARFCLALLKFDANIHPSKLKYVPWPNIIEIKSNIIKETIKEFY